MPHESLITIRKRQERKSTKDDSQRAGTLELAARQWPKTLHFFPLFIAEAHTRLYLREKFTVI